VTLQNVYQLEMTQLGHRFEIFETIYSNNNKTYHTLRFSSYYKVFSEKSASFFSSDLDAWLCHCSMQLWAAIVSHILGCGKRQLGQPDRAPLD